MIEKHGAIWTGCDGDNDAKVVSESYSPELEKLFVVYQRRDGMFMPFSYVKQSDPYLSMPVWAHENTKAFLASLQDAQQYLGRYSANS